MSNATVHSASYRDPAGFIFEKEGIIYRQVNKTFQETFDQFLNGGCYTHLVERGLLIPHETFSANLTETAEHYLTLKPTKIPFISYPYEWSFNMLKDAAQLTLQLLRESLQFGFILKDATPFNVQWYNGRLIFIDTLSFEKYTEHPWVAYRQFCETFLGPLLLMHYSKLPFSGIQLAWPEGIPLDVVSSLLTRKTRFNLHIYLHIHMHARVSKKNKEVSAKETPSFSKQKLLNLISSLETIVTKLKLPELDSAWSDYYTEAGQRDNYLSDKKKIISKWLDKMQDVRNAIDLGANDGEFSKLVASREIQTVAADFDPYCINRLYEYIKQSGEKNLQPLIQDLSNPTPGIGVNNAERESFLQRANFDLGLALAVIHHLCIGKSIPLRSAAQFFHQVSKKLIIEFVPADDEKVKILLAAKTRSFPDYNEENFVAAFSEFFAVEQREAIPGSGRILFLLKQR